MEYELDEIYEVGDTLIRVDFYPGICDDCYFQEACAYGDIDVVPDCEAEEREDMTDVIFVEI